MIRRLVLVVHHRHEPESAAAQPRAPGRTSRARARARRARSAAKLASWCARPVSAVTFGAELRRALRRRRRRRRASAAGRARSSLRARVRSARRRALAAGERPRSARTAARAASWRGRSRSGCRPPRPVPARRLAAAPPAGERDHGAGCRRPALLPGRPTRGVRRCLLVSVLAPADPAAVRSRRARARAGRSCRRVIVIGRSVFSRRVKHGTPRYVVSSCTPPESVITAAALASSARKSR